MSGLLDRLGLGRQDLRASGRCTTAANSTLECAIIAAVFSDLLPRRCETAAGLPEARATAGTPGRRPGDSDRRDRRAGAGHHRRLHRDQGELLAVFVAISAWRRRACSRSSTVTDGWR